ncbi:U3 snoRNP protein [Coemansia guatemalensis]|uniref:U3 snoRNP protein n=1 Tax=Coemansia guatemalensis TaxID=2761395 RepID=A0A9W8HP68_9FUNG|nr:U3 snoRNP protein [Coemansia guatemalensis]
MSTAAATNDVSTLEKRVLEPTEDSEDGHSEEELAQPSDRKRAKATHKSRAETDLERLVLGGGGEEDDENDLFSKIGKEGNAGLLGLSDADNFEDEESTDTSVGDGSEAENEEAPLFFMDNERDRQFHEVDSSTDSSDDDVESDNGMDLSKEDAQPTAAWSDDDMQNATVSLKDKVRTRKLRESEGENLISGDVYEQRLRQQFEKINPVPKWAAEAAKDTSSGESKDWIGDELLKTSSSLVSRNRSLLPPTNLDIARVRNANQAAVSQSVVQCVQFHPTATVLLTAGLDKTLRLFEVDGKENQKIQSIYIKDLPITTAQFIHNGKEIVVSGRRGFYYSVDVERGSVARINGVPGHNKLKCLEYMHGTTTGDRLAFVGNGGQIHLVSARTKQFVHTLSMNCAVRDASFTDDGNYLWSIGLDNEVYQWDLRQNSCVSRWHDSTVFRPTCLGISRDGSYYASGDGSGIVNLYDTRSMRSNDDDESSAFFSVKPFKAINNLTTSILGAKFSPNSEILGIYSRKKTDQLKLVHLPTGSVFSNWPTVSSHLGHVQCIDFSPQSGFMAVGNDGGKALLYRLQHYQSY